MGKYSSSMNNQLMVQINSLVCVVILTLLAALSFKLGLALRNQETDRLALLALKERLIVGGSALSSWNASLPICEWEGIRCGRRHQRVVALEMMGLNLGGSISSSIGNLSFLRQVNLSNNALQGPIPKELGQLWRLRILDLSSNSFQGGIPIGITNCSKLQQLLLPQNNLTGEIPFQLGDMKNLVSLSLAYNNLVGAIPSSLGNLTALYRLSLAYNSLEGTIPDTLGKLSSSLEKLILSVNYLSGSIPPSIYNLSSLTMFLVAINQLTGRIPPEIDTAFPNLQRILLGGNYFRGTIPSSLSNITSLQEFSIPGNNFRGSVPESFGNIETLEILSVSLNNLGRGRQGDFHFLSSLRNCSLLRVLSMSENNFGGVFPSSIANLSTRLTILYMSGNPTTGSIPEGIGNLVSLNDVDMSNCSLQGNIPASIGKLQHLEGLRLYSNTLTGGIPSSIGNLSRLATLWLYDNDLEGGIPLVLRNCPTLEQLDLSKNKLSASIPNNLFGALQNLIVLNLSHNSFTGFLPSDLSTLKNLAELYIDSNNFFGEIPKKLGEAVGLRVIFMQNNSIQGNIPQSFGSLRSLENLDLSNNNLSGTIPHELEKLRFLVSLNLSFNQLDGEVPKQGVFKNVSGFSFVGNTKLCGGIPELELPKCFDQKQKKKGKHFSTKIKITMIVSILIASISAMLLLCLFWRRKSRKRLIPAALFGAAYLRLSYKELLQATQGFASSNLIGSGSFGSVYKGVLQQHDRPVAVKVLNLQNSGAAKSFIAECKALRKVRHRNLVKIITSCSSIDYQGNDFKALIFEFLPNGSLASWIHEEHDSRHLNLAQRLSIAIDVANAIDYLHHHCATTIVHCDLKPTNVLLDDDMVAHVGDFGLAKLLFDDTSNMGGTSSSLMKGTIGYIAPEYGMGRAVSPEGDIYSYGIMLLEMITGRKPIDGLFHDGLSLHSYCQMALPERLQETLDFRLLDEIGEIRQRLVRRSESNKETEIWECLVSFTKIGIACSAESPSERMKIKDALEELHEIKARLLRTGIYVRG